MKILLEEFQPLTLIKLPKKNNLFYILFKIKCLFNKLKKYKK